jgi:glycosyltransferase involved in cell wall biosynthesis
MTVCVLNTGSVQSINRTIALSEHASILCFLEIGRLTENHKLLQEKRIAVHSLQCKGFKALAVAKYLKKIDADIYLCFYASGVHIDACLYARKKCIVIVAMGSDILEPDRSIFTKRKIIYGIKKASMISAKSSDIIDKINLWGVKTKCYLNYWGLNVKSISGISKTNARELLGLPERKKILLSPRAFHKLYNLELIAESFIELNKTDNDFYFVFIGRESDITYSEKIRSMLLNELDGNYRIDGEVSNERVKYYYKASDIVYSFAEREGFPNTALETAALKTNLICGEIGNLKNSFLRDNDNVLFAKFSINDIVEKTKLIFKNTVFAEKLKENALASVLNHGDITKNAKELVIKMGTCPPKIKYFPLTLFCYDIMSVVSRFINPRRLFNKVLNH